MYDFHKVRSIDDADVYQHEFFRRGRKNQLNLITRKAKKPLMKTKDDLERVTCERDALKNELEKLNSLIFPQSGINKLTNLARSGDTFASKILENLDKICGEIWSDNGPVLEEKQKDKIKLITGQFKQSIDEIVERKYENPSDAISHNTDTKAGSENSNEELSNLDSEERDVTCLGKRDWDRPLERTDSSNLSRKVLKLEEPIGFDFDFDSEAEHLYFNSSSELVFSEDIDYLEF